MIAKREKTYLCLLLSIVFYKDGWALTSPITSYCHQTSSPLGVLRAIPDRHWNDKREQKFLRIRYRNARGSRRILELQTAVVTMSKTLPNGKTSVIDLHSMLHFGDEQYFSFYSNDEYFKYEKVFYELLVSEDLLETNSDGSQSLKPADGKNPICPPPSDKNTATSYGLTCQLDVIDYTKKNWIHCDATREEYQDIISASSGSPDEPLSIWALASTATAPISQYTSALIRPFTPSTVGSELLRFSSMRLFTNLFLEGSALATLFRLLLWTFSPSPEVSILLLDWSSLVEPKPTGLGFSTVFIPVLESLVTGHIAEARRLVFAQLLVSSQTSGGRDENIVKRRNTIALRKLKTYLSQDDESVAVLYGAMHCPELQSSLQRMGYGVVSKDWRTAWSVSVPVFGTDSTDLKPGRKTYGGKLWGSFAMSTDPKEIGIGLVLVPLYLIVGGCDWLGTCKEVAHSLDHGTLIDALLLAFFYLMRHIALYLGLAKFAVNWDGDKSLFEAEE
jgi:hypothetical protein